jgi:hypothetical protein
MKPFDEPDGVRYLHTFGSGGFTPGAPVSTHIINLKEKEKVKRSKYDLKINIIFFRKRQ